MESEALKAFFSHVDGFATVPVYWPNVDDKSVPAPEGDHYRVTIFPASPESITTCGGARYIWILQVAIYVRDGTNSVQSAAFADAIRQALPDGTRLVTDNFTFQSSDPCMVAPPLKSDGWFITPVQCRFFTIV